jgi:rod shape-determining protein MreC
VAGIDHAPPPFFKRGPAPLALLTFYIAISVALFVIDLRAKSLDLVRQSISLVVDPVQRVAQTPGSLVDYASNYLQGIQALEVENRDLKHAKLNTAPDLQRLAQLEAENDRLRKLLSVKEREKAQGQVAQILYTARDPFSRRVIVDKGQQSGIVAGQPAIDEAGVVGQVTRVFPFSAEVTLITDKDQGGAGTNRSQRPTLCCFWPRQWPAGIALYAG